jgi:hypothetical protein
MHLKTSYQETKCSRFGEFITALKELAFYEGETTRDALKASLNKNIHFLYLPFVTISMYLADA